MVDGVHGTAGAKDLRNVSGAEQYYDARYNGDYMESWPEEHCARVAQLVRELGLPSTGRLLDFGCGTGVFTAVLKSVLPGWEVHGTDISTGALQAARGRLPDCTFHDLKGCDRLRGRFDFIFTHHVLEHVYDLPQTAALLAGLLSRSGSMLHILPCADPGSLEHRICTLRRDGIVGEGETRFFLDEEGHLRRLTTLDLLGLWPEEFRLGRAFYANQWFGAVQYLTEKGPALLQELLDSKAAVDPVAARHLFRLRICLVTIALLRQPVTVVKNKLKYGLHGLRDFLFLVLGGMAYPAAKGVDGVVRKLARREWSRHRLAAGGSEMYLHLVRALGDGVALQQGAKR